ncbi:MAG: efflux RND transporter periplasmic adaptor subunit [Patescibacteria group bacterium]
MNNKSILEESKKSKGSGIFKIFKKKVFISLILVIVMASGVYYFYKSKTATVAAPVKKIATVNREDLQIAIETTGKVVAKDGVNLSFSISGNTSEVSEVYVKEGQQVKKGDKIAAIETNSLEFDLRNAYSSYQSALASFNTKQAGATQAERDKAKNSLEQAKVNLEQAKISLAQSESNVAKSISNAENAVTIADNNLKMNQDEKSSAVVGDAYDNLVNNLKSVNITLSKALEDSDSVLGIDEQSINDSFELLLSAKNASYLNYAKSSYQSAKLEKENFNNLISTINSLSSHDDIDRAAASANRALDAMEKNSNDVKDVLDATIISSSFSQSQLDSLRSKINSTRSSVTGSASSLSSSLQSLANAKRSLVSLELAYQKAVDDLAYAKKEGEQTLANAKNSYATKELSLKQTQLDYDDLISPVSSADLASARSQLSSAAVSVDRAKYSIEQATLISPIDGQIALLNYKKGDIIIKDSAKAMASIINNDTLFIEVNIEESDINKVKVGQKAYATFDAVDGLELAGEVSFISLTSESSSNGIVTYLVRVLFTNSNDAQIREGMTANVKFVTAEAKDVLAIPVVAVRNIKDQISVENSDGTYATVVTGFTDGKKVEIISGLKEGDKITY